MSLFYNIRDISERQLVLKIRERILQSICFEVRKSGPWQAARGKAASAERFSVKIAARKSK